MGLFTSLDTNSSMSLLAFMYVTTGCYGHDLRLSISKKKRVYYSSLFYDSIKNQIHIFTVISMMMVMMIDEPHTTTPPFEPLPI